MSLQMLVGDIKSTAGAAIKNLIDSALSASKGLAAGIGAFHADIWGTGFAGVSNFTQLKAAISNYSKKTKAAIAAYNANTKLDQTFKGKAADETKGFIKATQQLLEAYVALVEKWNKELDDAYAKYQAGDKTLSQKVNQDTQAVKKAAQNVTLG